MFSILFQLCTEKIHYVNSFELCSKTKRIQIAKEIGTYKSSMNLLNQWCADGEGGRGQQPRASTTETGDPLQRASIQRVSPGLVPTITLALGITKSLQTTV